MQSLLHWIVALAALLFVATASAHSVDKGLASMTVSGQWIDYHLQLSVSSGPAAQAAETTNWLALVRDKVRISSEGKACVPARFALTPPREGGLAIIDLQFACAEDVRTLDIRDELYEAIGAPYHTIASVQWPGGSQQFVFTPQARDLHVDMVAADAPRSMASFLLLGVEHILTGYDHLLFLLALILRGGSPWALLRIVTAFTLAHSITLALAVLNVVALPDRLVESAIALSIAYVAAENLFMRKALTRRWMVSFGFGLVHGFGFSGALRELGLPKQGIVLSLLNFNLGVEIGQAMAVLVALPLLLWLRRFRWEPRAVMAASAASLAMGLALFVQRGW